MKSRKLIGWTVVGLSSAALVWWASLPHPAETGGTAARTIEEKESDAGIYNTMDYFLKFRSVNGVIDAATYIEDFESLYGTIAERTQLGQFGPTANEWTFAGPKNLAVPGTQYYGTTPICGRVSSLTVGPGNTPWVYMLGSNGGLWIGNDTTKWTPYTDQLYPVLAGGALAYANGTVYYGTGDMHKCYHTTYRTLPTFGVFLVNENNLTATQTGVAQIATTVSGGAVVRRGAHVGDLALIPEDAGAFLVASGFGAPKADTTANPNGLWRVDKNLNWTLVSPDNNNYMDLAVGALSNATGRRWFYAVTPNNSRLRRSGDNGKTWTLINTPATVDGAKAILVAASPVDPNTVYLLSANDKRIWKSTLAGNDGSWAQIQGNVATVTPSFWDQDDYNWSFEIGSVKDSGNKLIDVVVAGLTDLCVRNDPANNKWKSISEAYNDPSKMHIDQHDLAVSPTKQNVMYAGCDGGIYRVTFDGSLGFTLENYMTNEVDPKLGITQLYRVAVSGADHGRILSGAQDNSVPYAEGASLGANKNWKNPAALGDCGFVDISVRRPDVMVVGGYYDSDSGNFSAVVTKDKWSNKTDVTKSTGGEAAEFFPPVIMDNSNSPEDYFYTAFRRLHYYRYSDAKWFEVGKTDRRRGALLGDTVTTLAIAPSSYKYVYSGANNGQIWLTLWSNGTTLARQTRIDSGAMGTGIARPVSSISVDPTDPKRVLAGFAAVDRSQMGQNLVLCEDTTKDDANRKWTVVHANVLPRGAINSVMFYPKDPAKEWWVATDLGVFYTQDKGVTYKNATKNLPFAPAMDVKFTPDGAMVTVATFGRGIWQAKRADLIGGP